MSSGQCSEPLISRPFLSPTPWWLNSPLRGTSRGFAPITPKPPCPMGPGSRVHHPIPASVPSRGRLQEPLSPKEQARRPQDLAFSLWWWEGGREAFGSQPRLFNTTQQQPSGGRLAEGGDGPLWAERGALNGCPPFLPSDHQSGRAWLPQEGSAPALLTEAAPNRFQNTQPRF